ncbi:MAG: hypothetical protein V4678_04000 [Patescibacteria group bacterium]
MKKTRPAPKRTNPKKNAVIREEVSPLARLSMLRSYFGSASSEYLSRRPHRSFRRTRRRDYTRSLELPGYWAFSAYVWRVIWSNKALFASLTVFYGVMGAVFVGLYSNDAYTQLSQLLDETGGEVFSDGWGAIGQAGLLLFAGASGSLSPQLNDAQYVYSGLILLLTWLATVWLLRAILAGNRPSLRDGLYNCGAPIVATAIVLIILIVQLLPATIAVIAFNSAMAADLFETGLIAMLVSLVAVLLVIVSMYWVVSTIMALIIVTLPGMFPWRAIRAAGDIVVGRRLRLLLRICWLILSTALAWVAIVLPVIIVDRYLKGLIPFVEPLPIVPVVIAFVSSAVVVWSASYMYLLYRKVVEDDASPA